MRLLELQTYAYDVPYRQKDFQCAFKCWNWTLEQWKRLSGYISPVCFCIMSWTAVYVCAIYLG